MDIPFLQNDAFTNRAILKHKCIQLEEKLSMLFEFDTMFYSQMKK